MSEPYWFEPVEPVDVLGPDGVTPIGRVSPGRQYQAVDEADGRAVVEGPDGSRGSVPLSAIRRVPTPAGAEPSTRPASTPPTAAAAPPTMTARAAVPRPPDPDAPPSSEPRSRRGRVLAVAVVALVAAGVAVALASGTGDDDAGVAATWVGPVESVGYRAMIEGTRVTDQPALGGIEVLVPSNRGLRWHTLVHTSTAQPYPTLDVVDPIAPAWRAAPSDDADQDDVQVLVGTADGLVLAATERSREWVVHETSPLQATAPAAVQGLVAWQPVVDADGTTGIVQVGFVTESIGSLVEGPRITARPALVGSRVLVVSGGARTIRSLDTLDGQERAVRGLDGPPGPPVAVPQLDRVLVPIPEDDLIVALDATTLDLVGAISDVTVGAELLVVGDEVWVAGDDVVAYDVDSLRPVRTVRGVGPGGAWDPLGSPAPLRQVPVTFGGLLLVHGADGIVAIDRSTGEVVSELRSLEGHRTTGWMLAASDRLIVVGPGPDDSERSYDLLEFFTPVED